MSTAHGLSKYIDLQSYRSAGWKRTASSKSHNITKEYNVLYKKRIFVVLTLLSNVRYFILIK